MCKIFNFTFKTMSGDFYFKFFLIYSQKKYKIDNPLTNDKLKLIIIFNKNIIYIFLPPHANRLPL